jgi:hypothetical protein
MSMLGDFAVANDLWFTRHSRRAQLRSEVLGSNKDWVKFCTVPTWVLPHLLLIRSVFQRIRVCRVITSLLTSFGRSK